MALPTIEAFTHVLHEAAGRDEIDVATPLGDLDVDSLAVVEWLYSVEEDYNLEIDQQTIEQLPNLTIRDIYQFAVAANN